MKKRNEELERILEQTRLSNHAFTEIIEQKDKKIGELEKENYDLGFRVFKLRNISSTFENISKDLEKSNNNLKARVESVEAENNQLKYELSRYGERYNAKTEDEVEGDKIGYKEKVSDVYTKESTYDYTKTKSFKSAMEAAKVPPYMKTGDCNMY